MIPLRDGQSYFEFNDTTPEKCLGETRIYKLFIKLCCLLIEH